MKMRWKLMTLLAVIFMLAAVVCGCGNKEKPLAEGESEYKIYYLNTAMTKLVTREYRSKTTDDYVLFQELFDQFRTVPADADCQAALLDKIEFLGDRHDGNVMYLYFDANYTSMKPEREILCRAALAQTFTQIPGVEYISIYSGAQLLSDSNGMPIGLISGTDFIDGISDVNSYEETELTLYFADETGQKLIPEKRTVVHNINTSVEQVVIQELIHGPQTGLKATLDPTTKLLNVSVNENICYVNLDASFLNSPADVQEAIPVYSIVNSLSELSTVNRVQFSVNGEQNIMFREVISLNAPFERNLDYLAQ